MRIFWLSLMLGFFWIAGLQAGFIYEDFYLVQDARNFKESKGGKGFGPQGQLLPEGTQSFLFNEHLLDQQNAAPWHYVVSLNCARSQNVEGLLEKLASQLISALEKNRLGIILGINERITVDTSLTYRPTGAELNLDAHRLKNLGVPLLVVYSQWGAFRESAEDRTLSPQAVRQEIHKRVTELSNDRQKEAMLKRLRTEDATHKFPFGAMRQHTLNVPEAVNFLQRMQGKAGRTPVYVHIQDADFIELQTPLLFDRPFSEGAFKAEGEEKAKAKAVPKKKEEHYLFHRYDQLISFLRDTRGVLPVVVGGAHVYSPEEEMEGASLAAKYWTLFGSEMGNRVKHLSARYGPYGVYFHEPNTLILSPYSLALVPNTQLPGWGLLQGRFTKFHFGVDSELQAFTRSIFENVPQSTCQQLMVFSSPTVLATSMARGGAQRNFLLPFKGSYSIEERRFKGWQLADLSALHGRPQEVMHPNKWASMMCTSFAQHLKKDSRSVMAELFNLFDPYHAGASSPKEFYRILTTGGYLIESRQRLKTLFAHFKSAYDLLHQGDLMAFYIFSAAWEAGQAMRIMYLDHLERPSGLAVKVPHLEEERTFLTRQLAYESRGQYVALPNPFIITILELDKIPSALTPKDMVEMLAKRLYAHHKVKKEAARLLGTSPGTLNKLLEQKEVAMHTILKLASPLKQFKAPDLVERYGLSLGEVQSLVATI